LSQIISYDVLRIDEDKKNCLIDFFRKNGFNCFPIKPLTKIADWRYNAANTKLNQSIEESENYGIIAIEGSGSLIIDLDNKERFRTFAENMIKEGYTVIETGKGWHVFVTGLKDVGDKIELYDHKIQEEKIVEIQTNKHYVIGAESIIIHDKLDNQYVRYCNIGSEKIWDAKEMDYYSFIDELCINLEVEKEKTYSKEMHFKMRNRFKNNLPPTKSTSNKYFFEAARVCLEEGNSIQEATARIKKVYDIWTESPTFSNRPWSDNERTIQNVYEKQLRVVKGRPKKKESESLNRTDIAKSILEDRKIFSDVDTEEIFENKDGFLEIINGTLRKELQRKYPHMSKPDYNEIISKIVGLSPDMPERNKDLKVFRNGIYSHKACKTIVSDDLAYMGFKDYDYIENANPEKFKKILFDNVDELEEPRIKAMLRSALLPWFDSKISVIFGKSGAGKSTVMTILGTLLGQYALFADLDKLLNDRFMTAKIKGRTLLVMQELPSIFKDFTLIKRITGEKKVSERGFHQDVEEFENTLKIVATTNYLFKIPENEKNNMYTRRLSLIQKGIPEKPYPENPKFDEEIIKEEGSEILSWILQLTDEECEYEKPNVIKDDWENISNPETKWLNSHYTYHKDEGTPLHQLLIQFKKENKDVDCTAKAMKQVVEEEGYSIWKGEVRGLVKKWQVTLPK